MRPDEEVFAVCLCRVVDGLFIANPACLLHFPPSEHPENNVPDEASAPVVGAAGVWQVTTPAADLPGDQWLVVIDTGTGTVDFTRQPAEHGHGHE